MFDTQLPLALIMEEILGWEESKDKEEKEDKEDKDEISAS